MWLPSPFRALAWVCVQQCVSLWAGQYSSFPRKDSFTCVQHLLRQDSTGWRWAGRRCRLESKEVIARNYSYFSWQTPGSKTPTPSQQSPSARIVLSGLALPLSTWVTSPLMLLGGLWVRVSALGVPSVTFVKITWLLKPGWSYSSDEARASERLMISTSDSDWAEP